MLLSLAARQFSLNTINQDGQISKGILSRSDGQPADSKGTWWQTPVALYVFSYSIGTQYDAALQKPRVIRFLEFLTTNPSTCH